MLGFALLFIFIILFKGLFAGSEIAFISINERKYKEMALEGNRKAKLLLKLIEKPERFLSTIQIGLSLASILSGVLVAEVFSSRLSNWLTGFLDLPLILIRMLSVIFITFIISYLLLVFGELLPKRLAMSNPEKFSSYAIYPISLVGFVTKHFAKMMLISTNYILKLLRIDPDSIKEAITEEEIRKMVDDGEISPIEKEMIENIFKFDDLEVTEMMTHRTDVVAIDSKANFDDILELVHQERFTRYPVYEDTIDHIIGVIHLRELLRYIQTEVKEDFIIEDLLTRPYFVPDSKEADELFRELQRNRTHMGIVIDEYGGTAGIVTMENLIEEIMGEIDDEYDEKKESGIIQLDENEYLVEGSADLDKLENQLEIGLPTKKYETVNGFMIDRFARIPNEDDLEENESFFSFNGYLFSIEEIEERVISKVKVTKQKKKEEFMRMENNKL